MAYVRLREGESPEALVNRFRAAVQQAGILGEISRRRYFISKAQKARLAAKRVVRKRRRQEPPLTQTQAAMRPHQAQAGLPASGPAWAGVVCQSLVGAPATGWLLEGKALGLPVHEFLTTTSETAWLQAEVTRLRRALAEERRKRQVSEQSVTLARQKVVGELRSTPLGALGLLPGADLEIAEAAYRTLARRHHPDRGGNPDVMRRLNWAIQEIRERRG